jgi:hypothetical protein
MVLNVLLLNVIPEIAPWRSMYEPSENVLLLRVAVTFCSLLPSAGRTVRLAGVVLRLKRLLDIVYVPVGAASVPRRFKVLANPDSSKMLFVIDTGPLLFQLCKKAEPPVPATPLKPC